MIIFVQLPTPRTHAGRDDQEEPDMTITTTLLRKAIASGDIRTACLMLDTLAGDVLTANAATPYSDYAYAAASNRYTDALADLFGDADLADKFNRNSDLTDDHADALTQWFEAAAADARWDAELGVALVIERAEQAGLPIELASNARSATVLAADLATDLLTGGRYVVGTVLAQWRGEFVVWTVGAYIGQALECSNGQYFVDALSAFNAYNARRRG